MATGELSDTQVEKLAQLADALEPDEIKALANYDIDEVAAQTGLTRRQILGIGATLAGSTALGGYAATETIDPAQAQADTGDSDGNVGLPTDRVDVFADGVDANSLSTDEYFTVKEPTLSAINDALGSYDYIKLRQGETYSGNTTITYDPADHNGEVVVDASGATVETTADAPIVETLSTIGEKTFFKWLGGIVRSQNPGQAEGFRLGPGNSHEIRPRRIGNIDTAIRAYPTSGWAEDYDIECEALGVRVGLHLDGSAQSNIVSFKDTNIRIRVNVMDQSNGRALLQDNVNLYDSYVDLSAFIGESNDVAWWFNGSANGTIAHVRVENTQNAPAGTGIHIDALTGSNITQSPPLLLTPDYTGVGTNVEGGSWPGIRASDPAGFIIESLNTILHGDPGGNSLVQKWALNDGTTLLNLRNNGSDNPRFELPNGNVFEVWDSEANSPGPMSFGSFEMTQDDLTQRASKSSQDFAFHDGSGTLAFGLCRGDGSGGWVNIE